ncbi:alpha/beta hydrolase [Falsirhodobacter sp. 20TX0035]|uniref:alpha/beta hydrolase n=1 Tax=Falsirhodobacter sp. 20TX0035 TaxID=3022019 RepID=UPI00232CDE5E|nr:alpha/beta hydrolase-fold protein [Falsirhodobacter sp. 20TX0035]MDB6453358.1 alpha/beta hydrolase-fold protein [Falsirhodobacter sp. 20TX0035]
MWTRRFMLTGLALTAPALARAQFRPSKADLSILRAAVPSHRLDVWDVDGYRIFRAVPVAGATHALYLLDGNGMFDALTPDMLTAVPGLAVLGIGYPTDERFDTTRRSLDYTPLAGGPVPDPERPERRIGGAQLFLPRLTGPLRAAAEDGLAITTRTLSGHSFGGLFTLWTLLTAPASFDRYAAVSPSLWWGDGVLERITPADLPRPTPLFLAYSAAEGRRGTMDEEAFRQHRAEAAKRREAFVERLRSRPKLTVTQHVFPDLSHGQTLGAALPLTLPFAQ